jgi:hypothetical protein
MRRAPRDAAPFRRLAAVVLLVALGALLLQGAGLPHTHAGIGLYNQEHDLTLLATLHGAAVLQHVEPAPLVVPIVVTLVLPGDRQPVSTSHSTADSRAPPSA